MGFDAFAENIAELLKERMGDGYTVTLTKVLKNNGVRLTGVVIAKETDGVFPTFYLEGLYQKHQEGGVSLQEAADEVMASYGGHAGIKLDMGYFREFPMVEGRIFHKLIHYEKNRELLQDVPHIKWNDLAVVFYHSLEEKALGKTSVLLHDSHLVMWGKTAEEIYRTAQRNMKLRKPEILLSMKEVLEGMLGARLEAEMPPLYVLSNRERMFGASAVLYSEGLERLAGRLGTDLLVLPSSVHEVLLLPDDQCRPNAFYRQMVGEVNATQVAPEEVLSDSLYRYSREKGEIEVVGEQE